jgi:protein involved in polysaccharide export with SLBB domain
MTITQRIVSMRYLPGSSRRGASAAVRVAAAVLACAAIAVTAVGISAQEVTVRQGDRLQLTVPQRPDLELYLVVDNKGEVYIPVVGGVYIEGMSVDVAQSTLLRRIQEYYPSVQSITIDLVGDESRRHYYVHGEVANPGKFELEGNPNVWEAVREAGGGTADASFDAVRLVRAEGEGRRTSIINLQRAIDSGDFSDLPQLKAGDTVIIPAKAMRVRGSGAVNVFGAVENPAPYSLVSGRRLIDAVLAAGGTIDYAILEEVSIVRAMDAGGTVTMKVNFKQYLEKGDLRHNPEIYPGDTVNIPAHGYFYRAITNPSFMLGILTTMVTITAIAAANQ